MQVSYVYLAGPVSDVAFSYAKQWRQETALQLELRSGGQVKALNPLQNVTDVNDRLNGSRISLMRDYNLLSKANLVLVNYIGVHTRSLGTAMEIGWAWARHLPIFIVLDERNPNGEYGWITSCATELFNDLNEAVDVVLEYLCS